MRVLLVLAVSLSCFVASAGVRAQNSESRDARIAEAKKAFAVGTQAYAEGEFDVALASFRRAYELTGRNNKLFYFKTNTTTKKPDRKAIRLLQKELRFKFFITKA